MNNLKVKQFINTIMRNKGPYQPKFKKGDIIVNKYKGKSIVSKIVAVELFDGLDPNDEHYNATNDQFVGHYRLDDLINEHKVSQSKYTRSKFIRNIDAKYDIVDPRTAQILYGIRVEQDEGERK